MKTRALVAVTAAALLTCLLSDAQETTPLQQPRVCIVDLIPRSNSGEFQQDSEPFLAVSRSNPMIMAVSAFTSDPFLGSRAPLFISSDGGESWIMNSMLPSEGITADASLGFADSVLYAGILQLERGKKDPALALLRAADIYASEPMLTLMGQEGEPDQPFVSTVGTAEKHLLIVGANILSRAPKAKTATIYRFLDSRGNPPLKRDDIVAESRDTCRQDGPQVRTAFAADNSVAYAAFYHWTNCPPDTGNLGFLDITADVVVLRDELKAGAPAFSSLTDDDTMVGRRVAKDVHIAWTTDAGGRFGSERLSGDLAIAVDPYEPNTVYVVWSQRDDLSRVNPSLHVARLDSESGVRSDVAIIANAKNPGLAIAADGTIGLSFQSLSPAKVGGEWTTHFRWTRDAFKTFGDIVLARFTDGSPAPDLPPYLGDYMNLIAVGNEFRGVFSSANRPDRSRFLEGSTVVYQRNVNFDTKQILGVTGNVIPESIDPFYFDVKFDAAGQ